MGVVGFQLAALVALAALSLAALLAWLAAPSFAPRLVAAAVILLVGSTLAALAGGALRDLLQLIGAARGHGDGR